MTKMARFLLCLFAAQDAANCDRLSPLRILHHMLTLRDNSQIARVIVALVPVDMVNGLVVIQQPTQYVHREPLWVGHRATVPLARCSNTHVLAPI
jgi:hypothetical protein